jgi:multiple sugar transport system permease protein
MKKAPGSSPALAVLRYVVLATLALWAVFPVYWLFASSIKPAADLMRYPPDLFPRRFSLEHYGLLWTHMHFDAYFANSVTVSVATTALSVLIAVFGGYGLTRFQTRGTRALGRLILYAYMFPSILLIIPLYYVVHQLGLLNTRAGLVLAYTTFNLPFALWLLRSYFATIPRELDEAATIDGASRLQALVIVLMPLAVPGIVTTAIFAFINSWNEYLYASIFISSDAKKTLPVAIQSVASGELMHWGGLVAAGTFVTIPTVIFFFVIQRYMVAGLTAGAVKG